MLNIFKKKTEEVVVEGAEAAVEETTAETGNGRNKIAVAIAAIGAAVVGTVIAMVVKANDNDADDEEMRVPDTDEPIEVTDEMIEEVIAE